MAENEFTDKVGGRKGGYLSQRRKDAKKKDREAILSSGIQSLRAAWAKFFVLLTIQNFVGSKDLTLGPERTRHPSPGRKSWESCGEVQKVLKGRYMGRANLCRPFRTLCPLAPVTQDSRPGLRCSVLSGPIWLRPLAALSLRHPPQFEYKLGRATLSQLDYALTTHSRAIRLWSSR